MIVPCGIRDKGVTSLRLELDVPVTMESVMDACERHFERLFDATLVRVLIVPATMRLFGDLNWWCPKFLLRWLGPAKPH